jgi:hypothetical protein
MLFVAPAGNVAAHLPRHIRQKPDETLPDYSAVPAAAISEVEARSYFWMMSSFQDLYFVRITNFAV